MRSPLINGTLLWSNISRNVPLWVLFLIVWLLGLVLPLGILAPNAGPDDAIAFAAGWSAEYLASLIGCAVAAVASVCAVFEYLFNRSAAFSAGRLPVSRNTLFFTTYFAGLIPLIVVEFVIFIAVAVMAMLVPGIGIGCCATWLGLSAGFTFIFYNVCVFCALFSGTRTMTYYLFVLVNIAVPFFELALKQIFSSVMWGVSAGNLNFLWASPLFGMGAYCLDSSNGSIWTLSSNIGWLPLFCYILASLVLLVVAIVLNKRRNLENAGSSLVVRQLAPVLRALLSAVVALSAGILCVVCLTAGNDVSTLGAGQCITLAAVCFVGAVLGALVVHGRVLGEGRSFKQALASGLAVGAVCVAFISGCAADIFGVKRFVPTNDDVQVATVEISSGVTSLESTENIAAVIDFHRNVLSYERYADDEAYGHETVDLTYRLKNGDVISRSYKVVDSSSDLASKEEAEVVATSNEGLWKLEKACDSREGIESRTKRLLHAKPKDLSVTIFYGSDDEEASLKQSEIASFLSEALEPDLKQTDLGTLYTPKESSVAMVDINLALPDDDYDYWDFTLADGNCPSIVKWMKTHYGIDIFKAPKKNSK